MRSTTHHSRNARDCQQGFSLIEILVTITITSIALLGAAGLQLRALRVGQSGQLRSQAVFLATDLTERMEANKSAAVLGSYAVSLSSTPPALVTTCATGACTSAGLAAFDLSQWQNSIQPLLPNSSWSVIQSTTGNPSTYTITINWTDRRSDTTYASTGTGETFSYVTTRTVFN